ncbi:MAG TPA: GntR family transcriptional regulator [Alphaproteobacteria bacterium]|nr:GntR family transcriptional regulator [Alphaproteobacteria bacterium]
MRERAASEIETGRPPADLALGDLHSPLRDLVTEQIRDAILSGRYRPGARLIEERLAEDFRVSRNPVREALRALASQGLVQVTPRRGATVAGFSPEEVQEMIEVRATLEGMNAKLAARRRDPGMIEALRRVLAEGRARAPAGIAAELVRLNGRFHDLLAAAGHNRILADLMRSLRERTNLVFAPMSARLAAQNWEEHAAILEAVIAGDAELAAARAEQHVLRAGTRHLADEHPEALRGAGDGMGKDAAGGGGAP